MTCLSYCCECAVNPKIPRNLYAKLEERLRGYLLPRLQESAEPLTLDEDEVLAATIDRIKLTEDQSSPDSVISGLSLFLYKMNENEQPVKPTRSIDLEEESKFYQSMSFPNIDYDELWDALLFDTAIKEELVAFIEVLFDFSKSGLAKSESFSCNRILLLHGPPGGGKSSLALALAQKLSVRLWYLQHSNASDGPFYDKVQAFLINSNQLFSRWFAESGKLIQKLFEDIKNAANAKTDQGTQSFIVVIIDEVESLATSRTRAAQNHSSEPTDSIRAVNTLLTQVDQLRSFPNICFIATSNHPELIDEAFVDRIDLKREIGSPSHEVAYTLLARAATELVEAKLIYNDTGMALEGFSLCEQLAANHPARLLYESTKACKSSARTLKKQPLLVLAKLKAHCASPHSLTQFLHELKAAVLE